jgi:opacity protein-like surface antigen
VSRFIGIALLLASMTWAATSSGVEPAYREVQMSIAYVAVTPSGDWQDFMGNGRGIAADLGLAASSKITVGLHFGFSVLDCKLEKIGPLDAEVSGDNWTRYVGAGYAEYRFSKSTISPFGGVGLGIHAVHVSYVDIIENIAGQGDYGIGYSLCAGLQYRGDSRLGGVLQVSLENAPNLGMIDGWFTQVQFGVRLFL